MEYKKWEDEQWEVIGQPEEVTDMESLKDYLISMECRQTIEVETEEDFKFQPGWVNATLGAQWTAEQLGIDLAGLVKRHLKGDWGELPPEDIEANEQALIHGARTFSSYKVDKMIKLWVITEWNRSYTTILSPDEY